jgi:hypothetical protein
MVNERESDASVGRDVADGTGSSVGVDASRALLGKMRNCGGAGVNLDVYTIEGLDQRLVAVNLLEQSLASTAVI